MKNFGTFLTRFLPNISRNRRQKIKFFIFYFIKNNFIYKVGCVTVTVVSLVVLTKMVIMISRPIGGHFCEDAQGRDGSDHASQSKETL